MLIGLHIRRGDYKTAKDGKHFYNDHEFVNIIEKSLKLFLNNKVGFIVCSDEQLNHKIFSNFEITYGASHIIEDMYALASRDYIIGAPSTYNAWSCFYGNTPFYHTTNPNADITISSFKSYD